MHEKAAVHGFVASVHACEGMMREREPQRLEDSMPQTLPVTGARSDACDAVDAPGARCWRVQMTLYDTIFFGCFPWEPLYTTEPLPMLACAARVVL